MKKTPEQVQESRRAASKKYASSPKGKAAMAARAQTEVGKAGTARKNAARISSGKAASYMRERLATDLNFKLKQYYRTRIWRVAKGLSKSQRTVDLLGCSIDELRVHLESQFAAGMSWENYGNWHIDHKRPCASFDLTDLEQQRVCFHFTNLQPLWALDNILKSDNYDHQEGG